MRAFVRILPGTRESAWIPLEKRDYQIGGKEADALQLEGLFSENVARIEWIEKFHHWQLALQETWVPGSNNSRGAGRKDLSAKPVQIRDGLLVSVENIWCQFRIQLDPVFFNGKQVGFLPIGDKPLLVGRRTGKRPSRSIYDFAELDPNLRSVSGLKKSSGHFQIERAGSEGFLISHFGRTATYLNELSLESETLLQVGDQINLSENCRFLFDGIGLIPEFSARPLAVATCAVEADRGRLSIDGFRVSPGTALAIYGDGSQTNVIDLIRGELPVSKGTLRIAGVEMRSQSDFREVGVGYVPSFHNSPDELTVGQALMSEIRLRCRLSADQQAGHYRRILQLLELENFEFRTTSKLPSGIRKRVDVAIELSGLPSVLVLENPTVGMKEFEEREWIQRLNNLASLLKVGVLYTCYGVPANKGCEIAIFAKGRRIYQGSAHDVATYFSPWKETDTRRPGDWEWDFNEPRFRFQSGYSEILEEAPEWTSARELPLPFEEPSIKATAFAKFRNPSGSQQVGIFLFRWMRIFRNKPYQVGALFFQPLIIGGLLVWAVQPEWKQSVIAGLAVLWFTANRQASLFHSGRSLAAPTTKKGRAFSTSSLLFLLIGFLIQSLILAMMITFF